MHSDGPGLPPGRAAGAVEAAAEVLCDDSGLFSHGFDAGTGVANGVHWARGQGWALHGLCAVGSPRVVKLLDALQRYEVDGRWRTIVDDPRAPFENSLSALVAAAVPGTALGRRALRAAMQNTRDGELVVSEAT